MWIGDVDVPQPVLDAAEAGKLVVFIGAKMHESVAALESGAGQTKDRLAVADAESDMAGKNPSRTDLGVRSRPENPVRQLG